MAILRPFLAFCVITFEPIKIQTCLAPQNDRRIITFLKDIYLCSWKKKARNGCKTAIWSVANFGDLSLVLFYNFLAEKRKESYHLATVS